MRRDAIRPIFTALFLAACGLALHLPEGVSLATLGVLLVVGASRGGLQGRARGPVLVGVALALGSLAVGTWTAEHSAPPDPQTLAVQYAELWSRLDVPPALPEALAEVVASDEGETRRAQLFRSLEASTREVPWPISRLLYDSDGQAMAWSGVGLLHEPEYTPPSLGRDYRVGKTAITLLSTVAVEVGERRPWRLATGISVPTKTLPFGDELADPDAFATRPGQSGVWWLEPAVDSETAVASETEDADTPPRVATPRSRNPNALTVPLADSPSLVVTAPESTRVSPWKGRWHRFSALFLGLGSMAFGLLLLTEGPRPRWVPALVGAAMALGVVMSGWGLFETPTLLGLALSVAALALVLAVRPHRRLPVGGPGGFWAWVGGALLALLVTGLGLLFQQRWEVPELSLAFGGDGEVLALRLMGCLLALAGLLAVARGWPAAAAQERLGWLSTFVLLLAAAAHDLAPLSLVLLVVGSGGAARWLAGTEIRRRPGVWGVALLTAALIAATGWELGHRVDLRQRLVTDYLPKLAPPTVDELNAILVELDQSFRTTDLGSAGGLDDPGFDYHDLAFVLWRDSPLADRDGLSSLVLEPLRGESSSFAFGLALDAELGLIHDPSRWRVPAVPAWQNSLLFGEAPLTADGQPWGTARYTFLPRPGFRLSVSEVDELESSLVRGVPHRRVADGLPRGVLFGLFDEEGLAVVSPWEEAPPLPADQLAEEGGWARLDTPDGRCWTTYRAGDEGLEVLFLPFLQPSAALERVGIHTLGAMLPVVLIAILWMVVPPRLALRHWSRQVLRSYSRRLILVYTVLLLLPLIALNLVLLRGFEQRLHDEQLANARAAVASARFFLLDYLQGLDQGFGIETQVNRTLLEWISTVVQHQINLYWGSQVYASSQQELFTAGLLPRRIPGEIFDRLAYQGYEIGIRTQQHEDASYLELYAPLDVPGIGLSRQGLFLSVPLLEQEEGVLRELAALRRRAILATSGLFLLLLAVGSRLAASFTKPLTELIEGTRRIALGAPSLGLQPREEELSALVTAIDEMAGRIDEGRRRLVQEKQLVDRIVESITSAVVSLDRHGTVLLHNQVAAELLGATVGERLTDALDRDPRFAPLSQFVAAGDPGRRQAALRFEGADGEERDWTLLWVPLPGKGDREALLVVDDATEVLRAERLEAWAEMARIIAHEIKNPLTPIRLSTEHMQQVYRADPAGFGVVFERCTDNILRQVEELRDLASDFSIYSQIPQAELVSGDLPAALEAVVTAYDASARASSVTIDWHHDDGLGPMRFDRKLLSRAVRNLLENALRASPEGGHVEVSLTAGGGVGAAGVGEQGVGDAAGEDTVLLRVLDSGPGVDPQNLSRIFEPYFSTHDSGTGLGLAITRRIVQEHGGRIEARNRSEGGLVVEITLPRGERGATLELAEGPGSPKPEGTD